MKGRVNNRIAGLLIMCGCIFSYACSEKQQKPITIHLVGDSTMADKASPDENPERGWGQMLADFFNVQVRVVNHAVNGRSTRSFIDEGKWYRVMDQLQPGDYVFIQFGHNDQKAYDPDRYSNPWSAYRRNLELMVRETLDRGGNPVLLSSIVRRKFNDEGSLEDSHGPYPFVARSVAESLHVPFIDLQQQTEDMVSALGPQRSRGLFMLLEPGESEMYPEGRQDNTHLRVRGAREVAGMVARSIRRQDLPLSDYLNDEAQRPRVLTILGGHSYDTIVFFKMLNSMEYLDFDSISQPDARHFLQSDHVTAYDVLLFYDFTKNIPLKDSSIYLNLTRRGMPMLFLHHALGSFQQWEGYAEITGGKYVAEESGTDPEHLSDYRHDLDLQIKILNPDHPVTRDLNDFSIHDEGYSNMWIRPEIEPLIETEHPECTPYPGWVNHFQGSTIIGLMLGHDYQALENPSFSALLENALLWLSGNDLE